jgi:hypothetical protein
MGSPKCGIVGKSQSVLIMINPIIFTRTRSSGKAWHSHAANADTPTCGLATPRATKLPINPARIIISPASGAADAAARAGLPPAAASLRSDLSCSSSCGGGGGGGGGMQRCHRSVCSTLCATQQQAAAMQ